ncbi:hypothetical protein [Pseudomonas aeruginosa]|uniref:hypothetical protein n=1 Tax=Pseudomonas aeruginosa TaxID=287 RepID=UPI0022378896|nr:hypothetical protein [Pseudomonas aeruginosa]MCW4647201.1 hypothetical protein [Pseudomonas aeruginosa]
MKLMTHKQMLNSVRWVHLKAVLLRTVGYLILSITALPLAVFAYAKNPDGIWVTVFGMIWLFLTTTAIYSLTRGSVETYRYGAKTDDFIRRFYSALVEAGDIRP